MTDPNHDTINELITKHLSGESSAEEQKQLSAWINASEQNRKQYQDLEKAFALTEQHFAPTQDLPVDVDREWDRFTEAIGPSVKTRQLSRSRVWLRIAATLLLLLATGGILYYFSAPETTVFQTADNKEMITLPDGSQVTLNRNSSLTYEPEFGEQSRTVNLRGEAFFDVEADAAKPFIILTQNARVEVLGTSFNVNAYDSLQEVEVIVQTGVVSLQPKAGDQKVQLAAGQKGIYSKAKEQVSVTVNDDVNFLSWNTQHLVFVESDLASVLRTLGKTYHADIRVSADIPETCIVTVTFDNQTLESVLKVLESTLNLKYTIQGNKVEITEAGC